jgi:hypothetical protein
MALTKKRSDFFDSQEGLKAKQALVEMQANKEYNTNSDYSTNQEKYADNRIPFVDKHMKYLSENQSVNIKHYLSNLRLMTRIK